MNNFLVIGLGKFGLTIAKTLTKYNKVVLSIDEDEEVVQQAIDSGEIEEAIVLDATDEVAISKMIADDTYDTAFVCMSSNLQASILITLQLKELGVKNIICKAKTKVQGKVLTKVGATLITYPEEEMGEKLALSVVRPSVVEYFKFSDEYSIFEFKVPDSFIGKNLLELDLRNKFKANIIAIKKNEEMNVTPNPLDRLEEGDILIVLGRLDTLDSIIAK